MKTPKPSWGIVVESFNVIEGAVMSPPSHRRRALLHRSMSAG